IGRFAARRERAEATALSNPALASVDAQSTRIRSSGARVCSATARRVRSSQGSPLRTTRIAVTRGCIVPRLGAPHGATGRDTPPAESQAVSTTRDGSPREPREGQKWPSLLGGSRLAQASALTLRQSAPDAEPLVVLQCVFEALALDLAGGADLLRVASRSTLLGEEGLWIGLGAQRIG